MMKYKHIIKKNKAFTLVEILIATVILTTIFWIIIKTIFWLNQHNIRIVENIQNLAEQIKLQSFFTDNSIGNIIDAYSGLWNTEINDIDYNNDTYKNMIDNIVFSSSWLNIKKTISVELKNGVTTLSLPYLIFKDKNNKLWVIWFVTDKNNKDVKALSLKIFFLNNNYYFNTKWNITISDLLYAYNNNSDPDLNKLYTDYINDLKLSGWTILDNIVFINDWERWDYDRYNYLTPSLLSKMLIVLPTKNLELSNSSAENIYKRSIDNLWNAKLYYWSIDIKYYKSWRIYGLDTNFLVK